VTAPARPWLLTCYGQPVDGFEVTLAEAKRRANDHIRHTCPYGPMPWAALIFWYQTTLPELGGRYVSSGGGSWLNHHLIPIPAGPAQDHPAGPPSVGAEPVAKRPGASP